jgi:hypothetical protein
MKNSESINELAKALSAFQGEVENAAKLATNPFFKSKYADLGEVLNTIRPLMGKNGLSLAQFPSFTGTIDQGILNVESILMHSSGQWLSEVFSTPVAKGITPQALGSAVTYLRRYAAAGILGVGAEDDDGEAASHKPTGTTANQGGTKEPEKPKAPVWTDIETQEWNVLLEKIGNSLRVQNKLDELEEFTGKVTTAKANYPASVVLPQLRTREKEFAAQTTAFIQKAVGAEPMALPMEGAF